jgi:aldehyde dehydrogenase (NAD+)
MQHHCTMFVNGRWVKPLAAQRRLVVDPTTETPFASVAMATDPADVDRAVAAARRAFANFSRTTAIDRAALIDRVMDAYRRRMDAFAETIARDGLPDLCADAG